MNRLHDKMGKSLENFSLRVNKIFNSFLSIQKNLTEISDRFCQIKEKMINLEEYFNQLKKPSKFPDAYESTLEEIKRRIIFNCKIKKYFQKIENFVKNEAELRKQYKTNHGIYIPVESFPFLKYYDLKIKFEINTDDELSKFPKLLTDEEIQILIDNDNIFNDNNKSESEKDKLINHLQMQLEASMYSFDNICNNFLFLLSKKEREIKNKMKECDNLILYINNKVKNNIQTCPLCCQSALNNEQYTNINLFLNDMDNKIKNRDMLLKEVQEKYSNLVIETTQMKKIFFNYMNTKIANNNFNLKLNGGDNKMSFQNRYQNNTNNSILFPSPNDFQLLKNLLNEEKIKNNNLLTELNLSKTKYDSLLCDMKNVEIRNEQQKIKINTLNEKIISLIKEAETFKEEIILHEKQKKVNENSILELRQFIKQITEEKKIMEEKKNKEITKIKNKSMIFKDIKSGDRCIFVPHSENIYVCINLTQDLNQLNNKFFRCDIILDFSSFDEEKKKLIVDNSLILIATITELKEISIKEGEANPYEISSNNSNEGDNENENEEDELSGFSTINTIKNFLKASNSYYLAKISTIDYIIGFQGEELVFINYNNFLKEK